MPRKKAFHFQCLSFERLLVINERLFVRCIGWAEKARKNGEERTQVITGFTELYTQSCDFQYILVGSVITTPFLQLKIGPFFLCYRMKEHNLSMSHFNM